MIKNYWSHSDRQIRPADRQNRRSDFKSTRSDESVTYRKCVHQKNFQIYRAPSVKSEPTLGPLSNETCQTGPVKSDHPLGPLLTRQWMQTSSVDFMRIMNLGDTPLTFTSTRTHYYVHQALVALPTTTQPTSAATTTTAAPMRASQSAAAASPAAADAGIS